MQNRKARGVPSEVPRKVSPRAVRQFKPIALKTDSASTSTQTSRTPKDRSPKVVERRSPRSPVSQKKRPSRISELETQVFQLQEELKKAQDQLCLSKSWENKAIQDAETTKENISMLSKMLEVAGRLLNVSEKFNGNLIMRLEKPNPVGRQSELEAVKKQNVVDLTALAMNDIQQLSISLASAMNEIQQLQVQLEIVTESEAAQIKHLELTNAELKNLKGKLAESVTLVENIKIQLQVCKESEAQAQALASETLLQLDSMLKKIVIV